MVAPLSHLYFEVGLVCVIGVIIINVIEPKSDRELSVCFCQVAEEIWVCNKQTVTKWEGDIFSYKESLAKEIERKANKK